MAASLPLDWLISVDDHVLEPPHLWVDRVAAKDRDRAPHMVVEEAAWSTGSTTASGIPVPA